MLPVTDKFLWDVYKLLEEVDDCFHFLFPPIKTMKEALWPDIYNLRRDYEKKKSKKYFGQLVYYLKKKGYIKIKNLQQKKGVMLTRKGFEKVLKTRLEGERKQKRKDRKWLMVIFDIPEKKKRLRQIFREYLQLLKFKMLQKSVWVCPFDVYDKIDEIVRRYSLDSYVRVFLIEAI